MMLRGSGRGLAISRGGGWAVPPRKEDVDPKATGKAKRKADSKRRMPERPGLEVGVFVERVAAAIGIGLEDLNGRGKGYKVSRARELLAALGVERYGLRVKTSIR